MIILTICNLVYRSKIYRKIITILRNCKGHNLSLTFDSSSIIHSNNLRHTIPVFRTVEPIVVEVTRIVGEIVPNSPEKGKSKVLHSNATFIGFGLGMCVLGICIGCISLRMIMNKRNQNSERPASNFFKTRKKWDRRRRSPTC